jgi:hypothetical protein
MAKFAEIGCARESKANAFFKLRCMILKPSEVITAL